MKILTVKYQKVFPIAPYVNETLGIEIQLEENDLVEDALNFAKRTLHGWHKENNPHLYLPQDTINDSGSSTRSVGVYTNPILEPPNEIIVEKPVQDRIQSTISAINSTTDVKILEAYRLMVKGKPELQDAYDKRLNHLLSGKL